MVRRTVGAVPNRASGPEARTEVHVPQIPGVGMGKYDLPDTLVWVDIETLGLASERPILQLAICLTDRNLDETHQGQCWWFHATPEMLAEAEPEALRMHTESGL